MPFNLPFPFNNFRYGKLPPGRHNIQHVGAESNKNANTNINKNTSANINKDTNTNSNTKNNINANATIKKEDSKNIESSEPSEPFFEILGLKLYFDDILIIGLLYILYTEKVQDTELFICLILLLLN